MTTLHNFFMYSVGGVPMWFPMLVVLSGVVSQAIKVAKWTTAQRDVELIARFVLKLPIVGTYIALIPVLGDILHYIANDTDNLPPTLKMRVQGKVPPKAPPPPSAGATVAMLMLCFFACAHVKSFLIDFGKCEMGQVPDALSGVLSDVDKTLGGDSPNWQSDMESLGKKEGMEAVNCAVAAVLHNLTAKMSALDAVGKRKSERGQIWLAGHRVSM